MSSSSPRDEANAALAALSRYLRSGIRSTHEVQRYLRRRGVSPQAASRVVVAYQRRGLLDDGACARLWAEHWARRGYAWAAIRLKLSEKGLDGHAIEQAATRLGMASTDDARARLVVAQRARSGDGRQQRVRLARTLASRGFDQDLIERILGDA